MSPAPSEDVRRIGFAAAIFALAIMSTLNLMLGFSLWPAPVIIGALIAVGEGVAAVQPRWYLQVVQAQALLGTVVAQIATPVETAALFLAIPPLAGGLANKVRGAFSVLAAELIGVLTGMVLNVATNHAEPTSSKLGVNLVWLVTGLVLGLAGSRLSRHVSDHRLDESYRHAVDLISQLQGLASSLEGGLDTVDIADGILAEAREHLPMRSSGIFLPSEARGIGTPLRFATGSNQADLIHFARDLHEVTTPRTRGNLLCIPLVYEWRIVAFLVGETIGPAELSAVETCAAALEPEALRLHAALLFGEVRATATSSERQRLAREVHDGIAQDVASLGYLVDAIPARDPDQADQIQQVRGEVSRVVSELRQSVFDLRNDVDEDRNLAEGLHALAGHIGTRSDLNVHVSIEGFPERLPREVEGHLMRIAQEALNNARKHSGATNVWLTARFDSEGVHLEITDDGRGMGVPREDSYGLTIMRERATGIGAELSISDCINGVGTSVVVDLRRRTAS
ncbi:MAG: sensor histidine kinase [Marmoricola sp.]